MPSNVLVVAGPTASGKTALSIALAQAVGGEIVSADSMQVYRGMDIGTAKADPVERAAVPHHMLDIADPGENYSVARFTEDAAACCEDILSRSKVPVITGGTGLYIDSLLSGRTFAEIGDSSARESLSAEYDRIGGDAMLRRLCEVDPSRAEKLSSSDKRRIIRALEIYELTGMTMSEHDAHTRSLPPRFQAVRIVLEYPDRAELYRRIEERVDRMVEAGLFEEVDTLLKRGLDPGTTALQAIGYKESALYLQGKLDREAAIDLIKQSSRRYAKRQITWFGRWTDALRLVRRGAPDINSDLKVLKEMGVL